MQACATRALAFSKTGAARLAMRSWCKASRLIATGLYFEAVTPEDEATPNDSVLTDLTMTAQVYRWNDEIQTAFTRPSATGLETLTFGSYTYPGDLQDSSVFIPFVGRSP